MGRAHARFAGRVAVRLSAPAWPRILILAWGIAAAVLPTTARAASGDDYLAVTLGPEETIRDVAALDPPATLNVLLSDGSRVLAVSWGDPMSYLVADDGVVVASEPYDEDDRWVDVPDRHLLEVTSSGVTVTDLEEQS